MSCSDRRSLLAALAVLPLAAAGCGFSPAYGPGGAAQGLRGSIRADDPQSGEEFDFVERLEERLGRPEAARFALAYTITTEREGLARTAERRDSRGQITGRVDFELRALNAEGENAAPLTSGTVTAFTGHSATATPLADRATAEDAQRRLMRMLADRVVSRLTATAGDWNAAAGTR